MAIYKSMRKKLVAAGTAAVIMVGVAAPGAFAEEMRFTDVGSHYTVPIEYLSANHIVNGKSETFFGTTQNITRGETAIIIARALGLDTQNAPDAGFTDTSGQYKGAVNALYEKKIISGISSTEYGVNDQLTRGQMAKILVNAYNIPDATKDAPFTDAGKTFGNYIDALYESGVADGKTNTQFGTKLNITRGEFAILLYKAIQKFEQEPMLPTVTIGGIPENGMATEPIIIVKVEATEGATVSVKHNGTAVKESGVSGYVLNLSEGENKIVVTAVDAAGNKVLKEVTVNYDSACDYDSTSTVNPDRQTINCLITEVVMENGNKIPPEIVKAVAEKESAWTQFIDGKPLVRTEKDGREGIGIMQITNTAGYDVDRLKYDIKYNIETGVKFLLNNFYQRNDLPKINDHDPTDLESWYFAIMAYNGIVPANSPVVQATGERNAGAYQELVYDKLESGNADEVLPNIDNLDMTSADFEYDPNSSTQIKFIKTSYELEESLLTPSNQLYAIGDIVHYEGSGLRLVPATLGDRIPVTSNDELKIIGKPVQDSRPAITNHYVWYPVMKVSTGEIGYIASHYIK
ncbi:S-layer homology domain-containing protein [Bacillus sp. ISL-41]|uniref:S-layer homology domain-containing protein n=1 Tax=Bacillus sp. ISL-41 TaxID=2819127 RepID=UPI001BEABD53|nr:S-layer homology domain-containing protein [Bacillus sp. ISL-41]MBT2641694.1 S-layer homology domain-containing protein [Bacillus sp. ISL-41]